jgi:ABC-type glycerol-3-phosphate transport system permease component
VSVENAKRISQTTAVSPRIATTVVHHNLWGTVTHRLFRGLLYLVLIGVGITMLLPLLWMISTSLKQPGEVFLLPPKWLPNPPQWSNYAKLFEVLPFGRFLLNSLKIAGFATLGALISCSMAAFAFARMNFPGRNFLFAIILATLMIPYHVTLIPLFVLYKNMGWLSTHLPLTVPYFFGTAFGIFLIRQFYLTIPQELVDAARIDGCSFIQIYYKIFLPLGKPALATLGIFTFLGSWNNLIGPLIFLNEINTMTLTLGLTLLTTQSNGRWELIQAGAVISVVPMIIIFLVGQEHFIQGIARTGIKG